MNNYLLYGGMVIVLVALMYFSYIRPGNVAAKDKHKKNSTLKPGDRIMTMGGFYAKILEIHEVDYIIAMEPDDIRLRISPKAIAVYPEDIEKAEQAQRELAAKLSK